MTNIASTNRSSRELKKVFLHPKHGGRNFMGVALFGLGAVVLLGATAGIFFGSQQFDKWMIVPVAIGAVLVAWGAHTTSRRASRAAKDLVKQAIKLRQGTQNG